MADLVGQIAPAEGSAFAPDVVLPAGQRRAIEAVWDFCRAVDDAVDEPSGNGALNGIPVTIIDDARFRPAHTV